SGLLGQGGAGHHIFGASLSGRLRLVLCRLCLGHGCTPAFNDVSDGIVRCRNPLHHRAGTSTSDDAGSTLTPPEGGRRGQARRVMRSAPKAAPTMTTDTPTTKRPA